MTFAPRRVRGATDATGMHDSRVRTGTGERRRPRPLFVALLGGGLVLAAVSVVRLGCLLTGLLADRSHAERLLAAELRELDGVPWPILTDARLTAPERVSILPGREGDRARPFAAYRALRIDSEERFVEIAAVVEWVDASGVPCRVARTAKVDRASHQAALLAILAGEVPHRQ